MHDPSMVTSIDENPEAKQSLYQMEPEVEIKMVVGILQPVN